MSVEHAVNILDRAMNRAVTVLDDDVQRAGTGPRRKINNRAICGGRRGTTHGFMKTRIRCKVAGFINSNNCLQYKDLANFRGPHWLKVGKDSLAYHSSFSELCFISRLVEVERMDLDYYLTSDSRSNPGMGASWGGGCTC